MKYYVAILISFVLLGCSNNIDSVELLEGYWEIEQVVLPNGDNKQYTYNETIDYFEVNDSLKGFRKKLKPKLDGSFYANDSFEAFSIVLENDSLNIYYNTPYNQWKETILKLDQNTLKISNSSNTYIYKRYVPENLTDGKTQ